MLRKSLLLATAFILLLVAIMAVAGTDRVILASPNGQAGDSTSTPVAAPVNVVGADPREYTVDYVDRAISLYDQRGLDAMKAKYNSPASYEGEWYLFVIDSNDIYVVHPLFPRLIGTDIKLVVDSTGYELGKDIAKANEEGRWIEYLWPHPVSPLVEVPKVAYAKRHDGYVFASGYYPVSGDPAAYTQSYVQNAIDMYDSDGLAPTVAHYNSRTSLDRQWYLVMASVNDETVLAHGLYPNLLGTNVRDLRDPKGFNIGDALLDAPQSGYWFEMAFSSTLESGFSSINVWAIQHDGLVFASGYFTGVIAPPTPTATPAPTATPLPVDTAAEEDPFSLLVAVLNDAQEKGHLSDTLSDLLANLFIDSLITANTGETNEEVRHRLVVEGPAADRATLGALYNATNGPNWEDNENWLSGKPLSEWYGVTTDITGRVTELELDSNDLVGPIPAELGNLTRLKDLDLSKNELTGPIPPELANLSNLTSLDVNGNKLTGEIPSELANLSNLRNLVLWNNELTGEIPAWIGDMTDLVVLDLDENQFTGQIPVELGNLVKMKDMWLSRNELTGPIPPEFGNLVSLELLMLFTNDLSGSVPPELGNLSNLEWMYLTGNDLTGQIPAELGDLSKLDRLAIGFNDLSGPIPPELGNLANLELLYLPGNQLTGQIPVELGNLSKLINLYLHENQLTGEIPAELGNLAKLERLFLRNNQLTGQIPVELGNLTNLEALVIRNNQLTGPIPPELGSLANLDSLTISNNQLTGEFPAEIGDLTNLETFYVSGNQLTGCVPASLEEVSDNDYDDLDPETLPFCEAVAAQPSGGDDDDTQPSEPSMSASSGSSTPAPAKLTAK